MAAVFIAGAIDLGFAVFHAMFWRLFGWPERLEASGAINAAITQTLNAVLIYVFTMFGSALIGFALAGQPPPQILALGGAGFWGLRAILQPVFFRTWSRPMVIITIAFIAAAVAHAFAAFAPLPFHRLVD